MAFAATKNATESLLDRHAMTLVYAVLTVATIYPLLIVDIPPLVDYPAHLARIHILSSFADDPALQANYVVDVQPLPNLAMDLLVPPLTAFLSVYDAARIFVALAILTPVAGVIALRKVLFGHVGYAPTLAFLPAYNFDLAWGFLNFVFGTGLCLLAFAGWMATRNKSPSIRALVFSAVATCVYFAHLFAFGAYALMVAGDALHRHFRDGDGSAMRRLRDLLTAGIQFTVPALLLLTTFVSGEGGHTEYGTLLGKLRVLMTPFYSVGSPSDFLLALFTVLVLTWATLTRRISLARGMQLPMLILIAAAIVMPVWLFATWGVDMRMPLVIALVAIASTRLRVKSNSAVVVLSCIVLALFATRLTSIAEAWSRTDRDYSEFRSAVAAIPAGARVMAVQPEPTDTPDRANGFAQTYWGLTAIAVVERSAFVPTLFTDVNKQPLQAAPGNALIDTPFGRPPDLDELESGAGRNLVGRGPRQHWTGRKLFWTDWPHRIHYVVAVFEMPPESGVGTLLEPVRRGSFFTIYKVVPGSCELPDPFDDATLLATCVRDEPTRPAGRGAIGKAP